MNQGAEIVMSPRLKRDNSLEPRDREGRMYHIGLKEKDVGEIAFLPGDPDRVPRIARYFKEAREVFSHREYRTWGGFVDGKYVICTSTGIGSPSAAIAIEELARLGVKTMIRVGTCGSISEYIDVGSVVIADSAVRMDGTTRQYVIEGFPAAATPEVIVALKKSAEKLGVKAFSGVTASTDSFYVGQGRAGFRGYFPSHAREIISDLRSAGVLCFEMESSVLFTLGKIYGIRTGAVFGVVANRISGKFKQDAGVEEAIKVAVGSVSFL
jgi:uridine phosphorylase